MSSIKINASLFKRADKILKQNQTNFAHQFNLVLKQMVKMDQVPFGLEEYDTKDKNDQVFDLSQLNAQLLKSGKQVLNSMDIPLEYVINGYCRRIILQGQVPQFKVNFTPYQN